MSKPRSRLLELLSQSPAQKVLSQPNPLPGLVDEREPFPFLAIVGQREMKLALMLSVVNPLVGGVLLLGSRGTAKTTAVRSLADLLPQVERSLCPHGCTESQLENEGMSAVCIDCAKKAGYGEPLSTMERVRIVELPLNARYEDVVGGIDERRALEQKRVRLEQGILSHADRNILYIDEINLLDNAILDAILDAAAQGQFTVRRGPQKLSYWARFLLFASMNPEEGHLRPQIMDRFGLRVIVRGLTDLEQRYRAYENAVWYQRDPIGMAEAYAADTLAMAVEIEEAQRRLTSVEVSEEAKRYGLQLVGEMQIASNRADMTLFEAARSYCAMDERQEVTSADVAAVAHLALRLRRNSPLDDFLERVHVEESALQSMLGEEATDSWTAAPV